MFIDVLFGHGEWDLKAVNYPDSKQHIKKFIHKCHSLTKIGFTNIPGIR